jgi:hypothetical protein
MLSKGMLSEGMYVMICCDGMLNKGMLVRALEILGQNQFCQPINKIKTLQ